MTISEKEELLSKLKVMMKAMDGDASLVNGTTNAILEIDKLSYIEGQVDETLCDIYADLIDAVAGIQNAFDKLNGLLNNLEG